MTKRFKKKQSFEDIISSWDSITKELIIQSFASYANNFSDDEE